MAKDGDGKLSVRVGNGPVDVAAVHDLRRRVFVGEFGFSGRMVTTPTDHEDSHVTAWVGGRTVGCLTLSETTANPRLAQTYHLPADGDGRSFRFTKLAVVPEWRRSRLTGLLMAAGQCRVVDLARPLFTWLVVYGCQYRHIPLYEKLGFRLHGSAVDAVGPCRVLLRMDGSPAIQHVLDTKRPLAAALLARCNGTGVES